MPWTKTGNIKGPPGAPTVYGASGVLANQKIFVGAAQTDTNGDWSLDISAAGFTLPPIVSPTAISTAQTALAGAQVTLTAPTKQLARGSVVLPQQQNIAGLVTSTPVKKAGANVVVAVLAIGS